MRQGTRCHFNKVAVLGAGVMGAQIAAQFANAGISVLLYDLPSDKGSKNALIEKSLKNLTKLKPAPLMSKNFASRIQAANYDDNLNDLRECDFIIEAISERLDWKEALYKKITPFINAQAYIATNTSGLSVNHLAEFLSAEQRKRFCGVHFFNPPRYMALVELIPSFESDRETLAKLENFLVTDLGKSVVYAKDTPNFIANRVGVFSLLATLQHATEQALPFEVVDAVTGPLIGRPKSATFRTLDVVGLDTFSHVVATLKDNLSDCPWQKSYDLPAWISQLVDSGALGQKTRQGVYKKVGKSIQVLSLNDGQYHDAKAKPSEEVIALLKEKNMSKKFAGLMESSDPVAKFLWHSFRDLFHYCAVNLESIADSVWDLDQAIRAGFGWKQGPFEIWQAAGWQPILAKLEEDIAAGKTLSQAPLPTWIKEEGFLPYKEGKAFQVQTAEFAPRSNASAYQRQQFPTPMLTEQFNEGETIFETDAVRCWHTGDNIAVLSFKSKMAVIGSDVLAGINQAIDIAEQDFSGLVIWQRHSPHFSAGANLNEFVSSIRNNAFQELDDTLDCFQKTCLRLRYASIPTVAAAVGYVFGGGCELMMHCDKVVAASETYVGLVEAGVGVLPAGAGCKEMAYRAQELAVQHGSKDVYHYLEPFFKNIAMAKASSSAFEAAELGYLKPTDRVLMNHADVLFAAKAEVNYQQAMGYRSPVRPLIQVAGIDGIARGEMLLVNMLEGHMISEHDFFIAKTILTTLCGGEVDKGTVVDEAWLLRLEREAFVKLTQTEKTLARIEHTLTTGKPLRN